MTYSIAYTEDGDTTDFIDTMFVKFQLFSTVQLARNYAVIFGQKMQVVGCGGSYPHAVCHPCGSVQYIDPTSGIVLE